jgi:DNA-binding response OmpR family regulator
MKPRLLLVDDEEMFLEFLSRRLISYQYDVTICLSGENALEMTIEHDFDVVILDVLMPGMIAKINKAYDRKVEHEKRINMASRHP